MSLKQQLLANRFAHRLRSESEIDGAEWTELRGGLHELAKDWNTRSDVDKQLAGWLVHILLTTIGALETFEREGATELHDELSAKLNELYAIVDDLFTDAT